MTVLGRFVE